MSYLTYARSLIAGVYEEVGWTVDADNHLKKYVYKYQLVFLKTLLKLLLFKQSLFLCSRLRVSILTAACALGVPDCLQQASERFSTFLENPTTRPSPDLREIVYYYGMQQSTSQSSWDQLFQLFVAETDASEKLKLMYGLSGVRNSQYLFDFLAQASSDESIVRSQDYFTCVQYIAANPVGEPVVWEFYREQWPQLTTRFGLNNRNFGRLIAQITANFASSVKLEEVQHFFSKYPESGAGANSRLEAVETIKYNIEWLSRNEADITDWLSGTASPLTKKNQL